MENSYNIGKDYYFKMLFELKTIRSAKDNNELIVKAKSGDKEARDNLIISNTCLIHKVLTTKLHLGAHPDYEDLFQMGVLGLFDAIDHFDISYGAFSTYAYYWIYNSISREMISMESPVKIPVYAYEALLNIKKTMAANPKVSDADSIYELIPDKKKPPKDIFNTLINYVFPFVSLNRKVVSAKGDKEVSLIDIIEDKSVRFEEEILDQIVREEIFKLAQSVLSKKEYDVISRHFGFYNKSPEPIESIAKSYGLSKERIRQIKNEAINHLRHSGAFRQYIHSYKEEKIPFSK